MMEILRSHSFQNTFLYGSIFRYQVRNKVAKILVNILYVDFNPCQYDLRDISIQTANIVGALDPELRKQ